LNGERWDTFCVLLKGDANEPLGQGTYKLQHESFGEAELFLSPNSETEYERKCSLFGESNMLFFINESLKSE